MSGIFIDITNPDIGEKDKANIIKLKSSSGTLSDFVNQVAKMAKRVGSIGEVKCAIEENECEITLARPSICQMNTNSKGVNLQISKYGLFDFFDKIHTGVSFKLPSNQGLAMPNHFKSRFVYTHPFNAADERRFYKLHLFNINAHKYSKNELLLKNVLKGAEISHRGFNLSLYAKQRLEHSYHGVKDKVTLRLTGKDFLIPGTGLDSKVSADRNSKLTYRSMLFWDQIANLALRGIPLFISNTTVMGVSSTSDINPSKIQRIYNFSADPQKWTRTISSYNRIGLVNKTGFIHFSFFLFGNLQAHQKSEGFGWGWNVGVGNRLLFSNNFAFESLFNANNRDNELKVVTKFLYLD
jgi:hypothetical protein